LPWRAKFSAAARPKIVVEEKKGRGAVLHDLDLEAIPKRSQSSAQIDRKQDPDPVDRFRLPPLAP